MITRRGFLGALLAAATAPAIVRASSIMRVRPIASVGGVTTWVGADLGISDWAVLLYNTSGKIVGEIGFAAVYTNSADIVHVTAPRNLEYWPKHDIEVAKMRCNVPGFGPIVELPMRDGGTFTVTAGNSLTIVPDRNNGLISITV